MSGGSGNNNKYIPNSSNTNRTDYNYHHNNSRGYYRGGSRQSNGYYGSGGRYGGPENGGGPSNYSRGLNSQNDNNRLQRPGSHGNGNNNNAIRPYGYGNSKPPSQTYNSQQYSSSSSSPFMRGNNNNNNSNNNNVNSSNSNTNRRDDSYNRREGSPISSISDIKIQKRDSISDDTKSSTVTAPYRQKSATNLLDIKIEKRKPSITSTTNAPSTGTAKQSNGAPVLTKRKSIESSTGSTSSLLSTQEARRKSVDNTTKKPSTNLLDKENNQLTSAPSSNANSNSNSIKKEGEKSLNENSETKESNEKVEEVKTVSAKEKEKVTEDEPKSSDSLDEKSMKLTVVNVDDDVNDSEASTDEESSVPAPTKRTRKLMRLMRKATSDSDDDDEEEGGQSEVITMDEDEDDKEDILNIRPRKQRTTSASSRSQSPNGHRRKVSGRTGKDASGRSLLQRICAKGNYEEAKELINSGADVNEADYAGNTPLHEAALEGYTDIVELLLDNGAEIDTKSGHMDRDTALIDAAANHHLDVVKLLIKRGADPTLVNAHGDNAFDSIDGDRDPSEFDDDELNAMKEMKKLLVQAVKEFKKKSKKSRLLQKDDAESLSNVQNQNAFYDLITKEGRSEIVIKVAENDETFVLNYVSNLAGSKIPPELLTIAAKHGHTEIASLLIAFGAKINYADKQGMTPLMHAVGKDHLNMVKLLLENNANPNLRDKQDRSALDIINESDIGVDEEEVKLIKTASEKFSSKSSKKSSQSSSASSKSKKASRTKKRKVDVDDSDEDDPMGDVQETEKPGHESKKRQKVTLKQDLNKPDIDDLEQNDQKELMESPQPAHVKEEVSTPKEKEKEKPKVVAPPPLTEEEIAAREAKKLEMQKAREALEAQKLLTKKARKLQILENLAQLENKRKEEKREAELQELERKKMEEEEMARKIKEAEELAKQEIIKQDISRRKLIRSFYPIGLQNARFNAPPSFQVASKYLPLYKVEINGEALCVDVQVNLLLGVEDLYGSFPNWTKKLMSSEEKSKMWNFFWPMIGSLSVLDNLSPLEAKQLYNSEEAIFQDLVLHWVKFDDVLNTMKENNLYVESYNAYKKCGNCKVSIESATITSNNDNDQKPPASSTASPPRSVISNGSATTDPSYSTGSLPIILRSRLSSQNLPSKTKLW